jgi:dihydrofolate reductase
MSKVVMYASVSVDGFIAAENDDPGPLFEWLVSGEVALDESGVLKVSQASYDYVRPYWDEIAVTIAGRHVFDITDGWDGTPPAGVDHVVVSHRPPPEGWDPEAPYHFVDEVRMDVVPVVLGSGKRFFGSVDAQHLLEDPDVIIQGNRVLHLRYGVRRSS